jgi:Domain of unknown function (DUF4124)
MSARRILAAALLLACTAASAQTIYTWTDEEGVEQFTDNLSNVPDKFKKKAKVTTGGELGTISHSNDDSDPPPVSAPTAVPARKSDDGPNKCVVMKKQIADFEADYAAQKNDYEARKKYCEQSPASRVTRTGRVVANTNCTEINGPATLKAKLDATERKLESLRDELRVLQYRGC